MGSTVAEDIKRIRMVRKGILEDTDVLVADAITGIYLYISVQKRVSCFLLF